MKTNAKKLSGKDLDALFDIKPMLKTKKEIKKEKIYERLINLSPFNYTWGVPVFLLIILECVRWVVWRDYTLFHSFGICFITFVILSIIHYIANTPKIDKYLEL